MVTPTSVEIILDGPGTVADWQASTMYSAHRGGSADWPEHSMRAYTEAVRNGFGCLEVSLARTNDGVLVANHDPDINNVVWGPYSGLPPVSDMTWLEVQGYQIAGPLDHLERGPAPFVRLEDIITAYKASHVFMVDPKSIDPAYYIEIADLLDSHGGPDRFIGKWVGSNIPWSEVLKTRGYESWGAFYPVDWTTGGTGFPVAWADQWSMLGLSYDASQAHWDEITATGKPVLAHVCPDQASVETARAKGAVGFQVSGIESVDPTEAA